MGRRSYRPRPDNGSGDSPRPPFLSEFVNQIGKLALVELVYHLFGGQLGMRIHPHIERSFRLKTKASRGIAEFKAAQAEVGQNSLRRMRRTMLSELRKRSLNQLDCGPILEGLTPVSRLTAN